MAKKRIALQEECRSFQEKISSLEKEIRSLDLAFEDSVGKIIKEFNKSSQSRFSIDKFDFEVFSPWITVIITGLCDNKTGEPVDSENFHKNYSPEEKHIFWDSVSNLQSLIQKKMKLKKEPPILSRVLLSKYEQPSTGEKKRHPHPF